MPAALSHFSELFLFLLIVFMILALSGPHLLKCFYVVIILTLHFCPTAAGFTVYLKMLSLPLYI